MYYAVTARLIPGKASELYRKLSDGTIGAQRPDGQEIVDSMHRAVIDENNVVRWSEVCYCLTPLQHERETVYDQHFTDLAAVEVEGYVVFQGASFIEYLARTSRDVASI